MTRVAVLVAALILAGCATVREVGVPVAVPLPEIPAQLAERPQPLPPLESRHLDDLMIQGARDDAQYNRVATTLLNLQRWYECVKRIYGEGFTGAADDKKLAQQFAQCG